MPTRSLMRLQSDPAPPRGGASRFFSSRNFLKIIEDTGEVGFWSADLRTGMLDATPGLYRILGLEPASELPVGLFNDMIHPEDRAVHGDQFAMLNTGQSVNREFRIIRPDRTQRWLQHRGEVALGADERPSYAMGVVFDVTSRHDSMLAVMQRHDRLNALVTVTAAAFWTTTPYGELNEAGQWMALTGQSFAQTRSLGWLDCVHPEDRPRTQAAWMTAVQHASAYNTEYRIHCADGIYRWFNARGAPVLNRDGTVREWVGICLNVPGQARYGNQGLATPEVQGETDSSDRPLTAAQVRAARGMVGLSKEELAKMAGVSISTIVRLEDANSPVRPRLDTVMAVRRALEQAGVAFTFDAHAKPGVREA
ncbi:PAS domain-containing protein [Methylobacterium sp. J-076]|uniref:PAS domain-containing protein n=1 Tax=Methylobacterium sp. J-076 TaxID=2836655 RepID=UPI001FBB0FFE|nr:PAS domain-containing protein [Methylobacterium sp. J-076]MCJ2013871.1 PAS domain-containing protein [Methylobacterium sp. J-076]